MFFTGAHGLEMIRIRGGRGRIGAKLRVIIAKRNIQKVLHWENDIMKADIRQTISPEKKKIIFLEPSIWNTHYLIRNTFRPPKTIPGHLGNHRNVIASSIQHFSKFISLMAWRFVTRVNNPSPHAPFRSNMQIYPSRYCSTSESL